MSLKKPKNLLIIGAVVVALLVGTVLLGNYANILPAGSDTGSQVKACQAKGQTPWCLAQNSLGQSDIGCCPAQNSPGQSNEGCCPAKCCPDDCENCCCPEKCCPDKCGKCCCPKLCPPDCTKPCCAEQASTGCCPMPSPS
jgi:hypothetical protein